MTMTGDDLVLLSGSMDARSTRQREEARALFEARERLEEVDAQLRARLGADRIRELELQAARRDLDVKSAYNTMLERTLTERQGDLEWARQRLDEFQLELNATTARAEHAEIHVASLSAELAAERNRVSSRVVAHWVGRLGSRPLLFRLARRTVRVVNRSRRA
jgi:chromosome segregation ATPase